MVLGAILACVVGCGGSHPAPTPAVPASPVGAAVPGPVWMPAAAAHVHHEHGHEGHHHQHDEPDGCEHECLGCCQGHGPSVGLTSFDPPAPALVPSAEIELVAPARAPDPPPTRIGHVPRVS